MVGIAAGNAISLALKADGTITNWGYPTQVPKGLSNVVAISTSLSFPSYSLALIGEGIPFMTSQPMSVSTYSGQPVLLRASAAGAAPLCQMDPSSQFGVLV